MLSDDGPYFTEKLVYLVSQKFTNKTNQNLLNAYQHFYKILKINKIIQMRLMMYVYFVSTSRTWTIIDH